MATLATVEAATITPLSSLPTRARETSSAAIRVAASAQDAAEMLEAEPDWRDVLRVVPIELDDRNVSVN